MNSNNSASDINNMHGEITIIDGDVLEDRFVDFGNNYDKFSHIIVCDVEGNAIKAVPYMYLRNMTRVVENLNIVSVQAHPNFSEYAVKGEILCITSQNPNLLSAIAEKYDNVLLSLHQELRELEQLDMLEGTSAESLCNRLIAYLKTVKVCKSSGEGIFWLPENYQGEGDDHLERETDENAEDYTRRVICSYIKNRRLPMARIIPCSSRNNMAMEELINTLTNYNENIINFVAESHYAPILRNFHFFNRHKLLRTLMCEEFRCIKNEEKVDGNSAFIFNEEHMNIWDKTVPNDEARERLQYYVGDYFEELDLSRSFITGSAITASLILTSIDYQITSWVDRIELLYPKILTDLDPEAHKALKDDNITLWNIRAISETEGIMTKGQESHNFVIRNGSDVDIAVDNTVSDDEYKQIAQSHFEVIQRYYSYVKIRQYTKPKGDWNYVIYTDDPLYIPVFRTVEIYRSSFRNICSHHVGAVRGCFTSRWSDTPQFYITASAMWTSCENATPNYHYFAGRKSNPQDIIIKNIQRGIHISDETLYSIIKNYMKANNIEISSFPFYHGVNVPFSVFSASYEWPFIQKELERKRSRNRRNKNINQEQQRKTDLEAFRRKRQLEQTELLSLNEELRLQQEAERTSYLSSVRSIEFPQINIPDILVSKDILKF